MMNECLALVAGVCLNQNAQVQIATSSIGAGAMINIGDVTIESVVRTDAGVFPDRRRMSRYCFDGGCIYYHVYCEAEGERYACGITYNESEDQFSRRLKIVGPGRSEMADVWNDLRIASPSGNRLFPLAGLRERSTAPNAPWCRPREDRGCR